jgi:hypothetical protein
MHRIFLPYEPGICRDRTAESGWREFATTIMYPTSFIDHNWVFHVSSVECCGQKKKQRHDIHQYRRDRSGRGDIDVCSGGIGKYPMVAA